MKMQIEMGLKERGYILPVQCRLCGGLFDLNDDLMEAGTLDVMEVLRYKCGAADLLCKRCRHCH